MMITFHIAKARNMGSRGAKKFAIENLFLEWSEKIGPKFVNLMNIWFQKIIFQSVPTANFFEPREPVFRAFASFFVAGYHHHWHKRNQWLSRYWYGHFKLLSRPWLVFWNCHNRCTQFQSIIPRHMNSEFSSRERKMEICCMVGLDTCALLHPLPA